MSPGCLSDQENFILLVRTMHPKTFGELRGDRYYKHPASNRTEDYASLKEALLQEAKENWLERHHFAQKKQVLQTLDAQPSNAMQVDQEQPLQTSKPENGKGKGKGNGKGKPKGESQPSRSNWQRNPKDYNLQTENVHNTVPRFSNSRLFHKPTVTFWVNTRLRDDIKFPRGCSKNNFMG